MAQNILLWQLHINTPRKHPTVLPQPVPKNKEEDEKDKIVKALDFARLVSVIKQ